MPMQSAYTNIQSHSRGVWNQVATRSPLPRGIQIKKRAVVQQSSSEAEKKALPRVLFAAQYLAGVIAAYCFMRWSAPQPKKDLKKLGKAAARSRTPVRKKSIFADKSDTILAN